MTGTVSKTESELFPAKRHTGDSRHERAPGDIYITLIHSISLGQSPSRNQPEPEPEQIEPFKYQGEHRVILSPELKASVFPNAYLSSQTDLTARRCEGQKSGNPSSSLLEARVSPSPQAAESCLRHTSRASYTSSYSSSAQSSSSSEWRTVASTKPISSQQSFTSALRPTSRSITLRIAFLPALELAPCPLASLPLETLARPPATHPSICMLPGLAPLLPLSGLNVLCACSTCIDNGARNTWMISKSNGR